MTNESTCSCGKPKYIGREVCYDCYKEMFYDYKNDIPTSTYIEEDEDEDDFILKHEVAQLSPSKDTRSIFERMEEKGLRYVTIDGQHEIKIPKKMVFNPDSRVKDYEALVRFLLANMFIYDNAKDFDKVSYMFKEVDR